MGFRPAVYRLAVRFGLGGFVLNDREGVRIEIEGERARVDEFVSSLVGDPPPGATIDRVEAAVIACRADGAFRIVESPRAVDGARAAAAIPADLAPCDDCARELADPSDRRYRYPFINCTACGPRFTIVRGVPYDRANTTMAPFAMCERCWREYVDPANRRFHAEPNACPACGPQVRLLSARGRALLAGDAALRATARALIDGAIVAIKGAGGFVLACDATAHHTVETLRLRKRRPHKPFAVMGESLAVLERVAELDDAARQLVMSRSRPIVLAPARPGVLSTAVAPQLGDIGVFLPPTPLQALLASDGPAVLVMTSGNVAEEPIARTDDEALAKLGDVADLLLVHDREVRSRADDSVVRMSARGPIPIRRARGFVPESIALRIAGPPVLAVGAHERNTVCLAHDGQAVLSQHIGDLDHADADAFFREAIAHLRELLAIEPEVVAHDLHPDYRSTRWALASGLRAVAVQHHHAHVAACLAEHGRSQLVTGIAFDGTGLGDDGTLWGGEILEADLVHARRLGHLRTLRLVGGEAAIRDPWRIAAAALVDADVSLDLLRDVLPEDRRRVVAMLATDLPLRATGAGRWFDAVAALLGLARDVSYDGQTAAELEALAGAEDGPPLAHDVGDGSVFEIDLRPAVRELAHELGHGGSRAVLAARFHSTLAFAIREAARRAGHRTVVLTGGCFQNRRLVEQASALLAGDGFEVLLHRRVPPNDGGLALGQAAVALARLAEGLPCA